MSPTTTNFTKTNKLTRADGPLGSKIVEKKEKSYTYKNVQVVQRSIVHCVHTSVDLSNISSPSAGRTSERERARDRAVPSLERV